jgi:cytochrome c biogenesis protein
MTQKKSVVANIIDFLASVQLALVTLIALAVASIGGTIIPQDLAHQQYLEAYGPQLYTFLSYLDLFDMYNSWWFTGLLGLLVVNLAVCSANRLPSTIRLARSLNAAKVTPDFLKKQPFSRVLIATGGPAPDPAALKNAVSRTFGRLGEKQAPWGTLYWVEKGAFSRFGAYLVHLSLLVIVAGGLVGGVTGFSAHLNLPEGSSADEAVGRKPGGLIKLPFTLRLDKFVVKFYPSGQPSEYRSDVTILENGREIRTAEIRVNHPLTYRGITFYQSSYGRTQTGSATLRIKAGAGANTFEVKATQEQPAALPDGQGTVSIIDFSENLMGAGPAAKVLVRPAQGEAYTDWAFKNRPAFVPGAKGDFKVDLADYQVGYYTGLQVNHDPGVPLIWLGSCLMITGFIVAFFFAHQKLFVAIVSNKGRTEIILAGSTHRNKGSYGIRFDRLAEEAAGLTGTGVNKK